MSSNPFAGPNRPPADAKVRPVVARQDEVIYQNDLPVARVLEVEADLEAKEIRFGEIYESDGLLLPDECEYEKYRILIRKVAFASKVERNAPHKGRVLKGVVAEVLGYREQ